MKIKITHIILFTSILLFCVHTNAQDLRVIDNKGTLKSINKVTYGTNAPTTTNPSEKLKGDIYIKGTPTSPSQTFLFDGTTWVKIAADNNWLLIGNTGTDPAINFIGTIDKKPIIFKTNSATGAKNRMKIGFGSSSVSQITVNDANNFSYYPMVIKANRHQLLSFTNQSDDVKWGWGIDTAPLKPNNKGAGWLTLEAHGTDLNTKHHFHRNGAIGVNCKAITYSENVKLDVDGKLRIRELDEISNIHDPDRDYFVLIARQFSVTNSYKQGVVKRISLDNIVGKITQKKPSDDYPPKTTPQKATEVNKYGFIKYKKRNSSGEHVVGRSVSTDTDNVIKVGTDGGAYYNAPHVIAAGRAEGYRSWGVNYVRVIGQSFQSTVTIESVGAYRVTLPESSSMSNFSIQLSVKDPKGNSSTFTISYDDLIQYPSNKLKSFRIRIQQATSGANKASEFMWTVNGW